MRCVFLRVVTAALVLQGCAHVHDGGQTEDLDHAVDLYWKAVRWQDAVAGSAFVDAVERTNWLTQRDKQTKDLNLTSFEVQREKVDKDGAAATVFLKATWFQLPSLVEKTGLVEQRWVWVGAQWLVVSEQGGPLPFP